MVSPRAIKVGRFYQCRDGRLRQVECVEADAMGKPFQVTWTAGLDTETWPLSRFAKQAVRVVPVSAP